VSGVPPARGRPESCQRSARIQTTLHPCLRAHGGACSGRSLKVSLEHRCALIGRDLFQSNFFATTMSENRLPVLSPNILDPSSILAQHRHQISLAVHDRHHKRKRYPATRPTAPSPPRSRDSRVRHRARRPKPKHGSCFAPIDWVALPGASSVRNDKRPSESPFNGSRIQAMAASASSMPRGLSTRSRQPHRSTHEAHSCTHQRS
jgi:hypothetical protein